MLVRKYFFRHELHHIYTLIYTDIAIFKGKIVEIENPIGVCYTLKL